MKPRTLPRPRARARSILAIAALTAIAGIAIWGFWPRTAGSAAGPAAIAGSAASGHQHGLTPGTPASHSPSAAVTAPIVDAPSTSVGSHEQTSLLAAASQKPAGKRNGAPTGSERADVQPSDIVDASQALGGCLPQYGTDGQCLSVYPPSAAKAAAAMGMDPADMPHAWTCAELRKEFPKGIAVRVHGVDPQQLDTDADGVACDQDD